MYITSLSNDCIKYIYNVKRTLFYKSNSAKYYYTVKKLSDFPAPGGDVTNQTLPGGEFDIPTGGGKIANLFFTV
jgi:hypothetical protein